MKKEPGQRTNLDLNGLVRGILQLVQADIHNQGVQVQLELAEGLPKVFVDGIQIEQVLINLVRNALDAMAMHAEQNKDPTLLIRTYNNSDGMVECEVNDNGPGMDAETLGHIFEPFVTSKGAKGLGMGLSISRTIIESHHGRLWAESKPAQGASFYFTVATLQHEQDPSDKQASVLAEQSA